MISAIMQHDNAKIAGEWENAIAFVYNAKNFSLIYEMIIYRKISFPRSVLNLVTIQNL